MTKSLNVFTDQAILNNRICSSDAAGSQHPMPQISCAVLDTLADAIAVFDEDGHVVLANRAWQELAGGSFNGSSNGTPRGKAIDDLPGWFGGLVDTPAAQQFAAGVDDVLTGVSDTFTTEFRFQGPRGMRWFLGRAERLDVEGPARVVVTRRDITDQRRSDVALAANRRLCEAIFDQSFLLEAILSPEGVVLKLNSLTLDHLGATFEDVVGQHFWELTCWPQTPAARDRLMTAVSDAACGQSVCFEAELFNAGKTGGMLEVSIRPVRDESGVVFQLVAEGQDLTRSRRAEQERVEALNRLRQITDAIPDIVYAVDLEGALMWWNHTGEVVTGLTAAELQGLSCLALTPPEDHEKIRAAILKACNEGHSEVETRILHRGGLATPYHLKGAALRDSEGRVIGFTGVGRDITERKAIEARLRQQTEIVEVINRVGQALAAELDLPKLLQAMTDATVEITGAGFGAYFFESVDDQGVSRVNYTIKGIPPDVIARLPLPQENALFGPVFRGEAIIRLDDVACDPRSMYARHHNLPPGHPRVRSYLAVPVVSPSGQTLGGLLLGDERPGLFTEQHEQVAVGLAAQAAIALDNARLYRAARQEIAERQRTQDALRESRERLLVALTASKTGTYRLDIRTNLLEPGEQFSKLFAMAPNGMRCPLSEYLEHVHPDDQAAFNHLMERAASDGGSLALDFRVVHPDGSVHWLSARGTTYQDAAGVPLYVTGACTDVTEEKLAEEALRASEQRFRVLVEHAADAFYLHDADGRILDVNQCACEMLGYSREEILERGLSGIEVQADFDRLAMRFRRLEPGATTTFEGVHRSCDGQTFPVEVRTMAVDSGELPQFISLARDITERKRAAVQIEYQASHDALTGLPNRSYLLEQTETAVADASVRGGSLALLLIDLDRFKEINDSFGHHVGDVILRKLNPRLRSAVRSSDQVARLGGDEFAVLLPGANRQTAIQVAERILALLARPFDVGGRQFDITASVGISLFPDHGDDTHALLKHADVAMYAAKRARSGYQFYTESQADYTPRRLTLIAELRRAIEGNQLLLFYQPKLELAAGHLLGCEALVRWPHPQEGLIPPAQFIPLAEQTGLIRPLCLWAFEAALRECAEWQRAGLDLSVSVNLAADNLQDPNLCSTLDRLFSDEALSPHWLTVEVTESAMMADPCRAKTILGWLHDTGVRISIDDFGTGYSSLSYLKDLPVDEVKIDRVFVKEMITDRQAACITRAVIDLGHNLGLSVVAEGIEDEATRDMLIAYGCDVGQGYLFSKPVPASDFLGLATAKHAFNHVL